MWPSEIATGFFVSYHVRHTGNAQCYTVLRCFFQEFDRSIAYCFGACYAHLSKYRSLSTLPLMHRLKEIFVSPLRRKTVWH